MNLKPKEMDELDGPMPGCTCEDCEEEAAFAAVIAGAS